MQQMMKYDCKKIDMKVYLVLERGPNRVPTKTKQGRRMKMIKSV
jgi:hypothetical protein